MSKRRTDAVGKPMMVMLPKEGYEDSGEGGLAFYIVVPQIEGYDNRRNITCEQNLKWYTPDCCQTESFREDRMLDAGVLIGSTGLSLWSEEKGEYFCPAYKDLTVKGQQLFDLLGTIFGDVHIVTLLDT